ncbi:phosphotransferase family protein [Aquirufa sp. KTFRIE-69F]|uniref:Phosphotransferase family protein n=1 Tax=Aquirufa originis TaxID=3096514 RepID=A0ABW6D345_9BACT
MEGFEKLPAYLCVPSVEVTAFPGGFSNLTYQVVAGDSTYVLRRPPHGLKIAKAHDMIREFRVLQALEKAGYTKMPHPISACEDESIIGAPFFLMEKVDGMIIRNRPPAEATGAFFRQLSTSALDFLIDLHSLELADSGLGALGKPEGYALRQVQGWAERFQKAKTSEVTTIEEAFDWLYSALPSSSDVAFIHNDFKYDNLVISASGEVQAVLDWEMATVGDPLMDLGTTLAYWAEAGDEDILKMFNLSYVPGNFTRREVIDYYASKTGRDMSNMVFYYVFGLCKVATIAQQIYQRFSLGYSKDPRFSVLNQVVEAAGRKAIASIQTGNI